MTITEKNELLDAVGALEADTLSKALYISETICLGYFGKANPNAGYLVDNYVKFNALIDAAYDYICTAKQDAMRVVEALKAIQTDL